MTTNLTDDKAPVPDEELDQMIWKLERDGMTPKLLALMRELRERRKVDFWIPVSERMPERETDVQLYCADSNEQMVGFMERNEGEGEFRFATWRSGTGIYCKPSHWQPLPAAPQEVK